MQGAEHQVSGLGRAERRFHRFTVPHLANHNHVWVLTHRIFERGAKILGVRAHLALHHDALLVFVQHLDGVFHRNHVIGVGAVDVVHQASQGHGLARTRLTRHQKQSAFKGSKLDHVLRRQTQRFEGRNHLTNDSHDNTHAAALPEHITAKAGHAGKRVSKIEFVFILELFPLLRGQEHSSQGFCVRRGQVFIAKAHQPSVNASGGR